jgi:citrate synthase
MSGSSPLHTRIWQEEAQADNPFATHTAYCHGYDVYGQMLGQARWVDMLYLLFKGEAPSPAQARMLEALSLALANPGPRDPMVHAAMCGGVGGSHAAASLIAALAVGAGQSGGAREVRLAMDAWTRCDRMPEACRDATDMITHLLDHTPPTWLATSDSGWPDREHPAGFDPHGVSTAGIVLKTLHALAQMGVGPRLPWLASHRASLEAAAGLPLAMTGVAAAALVDLGFTPTQGEMLHLFLRLPGAAAHALEQQMDYGFKRFPYPPVDLLDDPLRTQPGMREEAPT